MRLHTVVLAYDSEVDSTLWFLETKNAAVSQDQRYQDQDGYKNSSTRTSETASKQGELE